MCADGNPWIGRHFETLTDLPQAPKGTLGRVIAVEPESGPVKGVRIEWCPVTRPSKADPEGYRSWFTVGEPALLMAEVHHQWWSKVARQVVNVCDYGDATAGAATLAVQLKDFGPVKMVELLRPYGAGVPTALLRLYNADLHIVQFHGFAKTGSLTWGAPEGTPGVQNLAQLFAQLAWPYSEEQIATWDADHYILWHSKLMACQSESCVHLPDFTAPPSLLGARDILVFRGRKYWPTPEHVVREVHRMGLSVRIPRHSIPEGMVRGVSRIALAHTQATMYVDGVPVRQKTHLALLDALGARFAALNDPRVNRLLSQKFEHWPSRWLAMPEELADPILRDLHITYGQGVFGYSYWTGTTYYLKEDETAVPPDLAERGVGGARAIQIDEGDRVAETAESEDAELADHEPV